MDRKEFSSRDIFKFTPPDEELMLAMFNWMSRTLQALENEYLLSISTVGQRSNVTAKKSK